VAAAARDLRIDGTVLLTVAAERLMSESSEMKSIASEPRSQHMFVTPTLSTVMNSSSGVLSAICDGILHGIIIVLHVGLLSINQSINQSESILYGAVCCERNRDA